MRDVPPDVRVWVTADRVQWARGGTTFELALAEPSAPGIGLSSNGSATSIEEYVTALDALAASPTGLLTWATSHKDSHAIHLALERLVKAVEAQSGERPARVGRCIDVQIRAGRLDAEVRRPIHNLDRLRQDASGSLDALLSSLRKTPMGCGGDASGADRILLSALNPPSPITLLSALGIPLLERIDGLFAARMAWTTLFAFRRRLSEASRIWNQQHNELLEAEQRAERHGEAWAIADVGPRREILESLVCATGSDLSPGVLRRWRVRASRLPGLAISLATPFALLLALAIARPPSVPAWLALAGLGFLFAAAWQAHELLSSHALLLWGGTGGGVLAAVLAAVGGTTWQKPVPPQAALLLVTLLVSGVCYLGARLPLALSVASRIQRTAGLAVIIVCFQLAVLTIVTPAILSWQPTLLAPLDVVRTSVGGLELRLPVVLIVCSALLVASLGIWTTAMRPSSLNDQLKLELPALDA